MQLLYYLTILGLFGQAARFDTVLERRAYLMGTEVTLRLETTDRSEGLDFLEGLLEILEATEQQLSTWRGDSDLSRLNRTPLSASVELSPELCRLFQVVQEWSGRTKRAFDPATGSLIDVYALRSGGRHPTRPEVEAALERSGMDKVDFEPKSCLWSRRADLWVDAGAFGKGEALRRVAAAARDDPQHGLLLINLGGQLWARPSPARAAAWTIALASPLNRTEIAFSIPLRSGSLATSGGSERDLDVRGKRIGHIIDPRNGRPALFQGSVSVWHPDPLVADILSTALYVMGPKHGLAWAEQANVAAVFLVPLHGDEVDRRATSSFRRRFHHLTTKTRQ